MFLICGYFNCPMSNVFVYENDKNNIKIYMFKNNKKTQMNNILFQFYVR